MQQKIISPGFSDGKSGAGMTLISNLYPFTPVILNIRLNKMQSVLTKETPPVTAAAHYWPVVSLIMPFEHKMIASTAFTETGRHSIAPERILKDYNHIALIKSY